MQPSGCDFCPPRAHEPSGLEGTPEPAGWTHVPRPARPRNRTLRGRTDARGSASSLDDSGPRAKLKRIPGERLGIISGRSRARGVRGGSGTSDLDPGAARGAHGGQVPDPETASGDHFRTLFEASTPPPRPGPSKKDPRMQLGDRLPNGRTGVRTGNRSARGRLDPIGATGTRAHRVASGRRSSSPGRPAAPARGAAAAPVPPGSRRPRPRVTTRSPSRSRGSSAAAASARFSTWVTSRCPWRAIASASASPVIAGEWLLAGGVDVDDDQHVGVVEGGGELGEQIARARVAVRLEGDDQPAAERPSRAPASVAASRPGGGRSRRRP